MQVNGNTHFSSFAFYLRAQKSQKEPLVVFFRKNVLRYLAKFAGKHLYRSLLFVKLQSSNLQIC